MATASEDGVSIGEGLRRRIDAEHAIQRRFALFPRLGDTLQWGRIADECFTADAVLEHEGMDGSIDVFEGRDVIAAFYQEAAELTEMVAHVAGQVVIDWDEVAPGLTAYVTAWYWFKRYASKGETRPADWGAVHLVEDEYREVTGEWMIARRKVSRVGGAVAVGAMPDFLHG